MLSFEYKKLRVSYQEKINIIAAQMSIGPEKNVTKKNISIGLGFGNCSVDEATITQLIHIRSVLQYFMQTFWKRQSKSGAIEERFRINSKIEADHLSLSFITRHKNGLVTLQIEAVYALNNYSEYFDCQEVMMLDMAFAKAINLLTTDQDPNWKAMQFRSY